MTFPSPIGELHFSIVLFATLGIFLWIVSVPYRGATFLNIQFEELAKGYEAVSVPYRGATFLNIVLHILDKEGTTFPSPIGELHFSMKCLNRFSQMTKFPSPIGELHFSMNQSSL